MAPFMISRYGFKPEEDRVLVFFAEHGATRALPNGRSLGYIIPVDADVSNYQSQAISMTKQDSNTLAPSESEERRVLERAGGDNRIVHDCSPAEGFRRGGFWRLTRGTAGAVTTSLSAGNPETRGSGPRERERQPMSPDRASAGRRRARPQA